MKEAAAKRRRKKKRKQVTGQGNRKKKISQQVKSDFDLGAQNKRRGEKRKRRKEFGPPSPKAQKSKAQLLSTPPRPK
jgi:hypothetical protein